MVSSQFFVSFAVTGRSSSVALLSPRFLERAIRLVAPRVCFAVLVCFPVFTLLAAVVDARVMYALQCLRGPAG